MTAERMRFHVSEKPVAVDSELIDATISIGVSAQRSPATELPRKKTWCAPAVPLSIAKANGRNRVEEAPGIGSSSSARQLQSPNH